MGEGRNAGLTAPQSTVLRFVGLRVHSARMVAHDTKDLCGLRCFLLAERVAFVRRHVGRFPEPFLVVERGFLGEVARL